MLRVYVHYECVYMNLHNDSDIDFLTQFDVSQGIMIRKARSKSFKKESESALKTLEVSNTRGTK